MEKSIQMTNAFLQRLPVIMVGYGVNSNLSVSVLMDIGREILIVCPSQSVKMEKKEIPTVNVFLNAREDLYGLKRGKNA